EVGSATPQENFHFIEESLLNAIPDLPKAPSKNYEGRITQGAAAVLLMRLYFNASWYINIPMWEQTGALCERIINGEFGTYSLTSEWTDLWNAGNQDCPELIWSY
ncbi:RagB/SusD family nutrient uptake outer membrane protein, partial [Parabacteroides distasonis]|nr:RagB/SusD family nutrient uptake outer membrane protein [Parabacteroides distasonis]